MITIDDGRIWTTLRDLQRKVAETTGELDEMEHAAYDARLDAGLAEMAAKSALEGANSAGEAAKKVAVATDCAGHGADRRGVLVRQRKERLNLLRELLLGRHHRQLGARHRRNDLLESGEVEVPLVENVGELGQGDQLFADGLVDLLRKLFVLVGRLVGHGGLHRSVSKSPEPSDVDGALSPDSAFARGGWIG